MKYIQFKDLSEDDQLAIFAFMDQVHWDYRYLNDLMAHYVSPLGGVNELINAWEKKSEKLDSDFRKKVNWGEVPPEKYGGWLRTAFNKLIKEQGKQL